MERIPETLDWLYSLEARGEIYKLERMDQALALIGNPHHKLRAVHIAGHQGQRIGRRDDRRLPARGRAIDAGSTPSRIW